MNTWQGALKNRSIKLFTQCYFTSTFLIRIIHKITPHSLTVQILWISGHTLVGLGEVAYPGDMECSTFCTKPTDPIEDLNSHKAISQRVLHCQGKEN